MGAVGGGPSPLVGVGCCDGSFGSLVCFFAGVSQLGGGFDAAFVVVGERFQHVEVVA